MRWAYSQVISSWINPENAVISAGFEELMHKVVDARVAIYKHHMMGTQSAPQTCLHSSPQFESSFTSFRHRPLGSWYQYSCLDFQCVPDIYSGFRILMQHLVYALIFSCF